MRYSFFGLILIVFFFTACNYRYVYKPLSDHSDPAASKMYTHGIPTLYKQVDSIDLFGDLTSNGQRDYSLTVGLVNNAEHSVTFYPEDVRAWGYNADGKKVSLRVFTAKEYIRRKNTNTAIWATVAVVATVATAVAINDATGPRPNSDFNRNNNNWNSDFWFWMALSSPPIVINNGGAPAPRRPDNLLRSHTLLPGESLQGIIKVRSNDPLLQRIAVEIPVNGTKSVFAFGQRERLR
jgi:hypothetical protein